MSDEVSYAEQVLREYTDRKCTSWTHVPEVHVSVMPHVALELLRSLPVVEAEVPTPFTHFCDGVKGFIVLFNLWDGNHYFVNAEGCGYARYTFRIEGHFSERQKSL